MRRPGQADRAAALAALDAVGLAGEAGTASASLSGGQRQRVLLARAIAQEARLLLLDEPFNGVDAVTQQLLLAALGRLRADGAAVVVATHDLALAHLACGEVCLLNRHQVGFGPVGADPHSRAAARRLRRPGDRARRRGHDRRRASDADLLLEPLRLPVHAAGHGEVLLLGLLTGVAGVFVVLRRLAFMTDALTHTVFPGVVIAHLAGCSLASGRSPSARSPRCC